MTFVLKDRVRETTLTTGTGAFTLAGAVANYRAFSSVLANGDTTWYACVLPGSAWEVGIGTWVTGNTLQRTTILDSSNAGAAVNFAAGTKDVFIALPASKGNVQNNVFPSGTLMLFQQTNAPIYWTKQVTHNDKALRVVSGTASSGGANAFSSQFNTTITVGNTTPSISTTAAHTHTDVEPTVATLGGSNGGVQATATNTGSTGGGTAHNHTLSIAIQYVDLIIASKD